MTLLTGIPYITIIKKLKKQNKCSKKLQKIVVTVPVNTTLFFYSDSFLSFLQFPISIMPLSKIKQIFFSFSSYFGNAIHYHKFIPTNFFPLYIGNATVTNQLLLSFFRNDVHTIFTIFLQQILNDWLCSQLLLLDYKSNLSIKFKFVVKILWTKHFFFFNSSPDSGNHFFPPPIFGYLNATIHVFSLLNSLQFRLPHNQ